MKIVITGGHVTPALATIEALREKDSDISVHFIGRMHTREGDGAVSAEYTLMQKMQIPFYPLTTGRLQRSITRYTIPSLLKIPIGLYQSILYLKSIRPDVVLSFGGYLAVPVAIAARLLSIPVISHEQTLVPGLANRIISYFATVMAFSFKESERYYRHCRYVVTGNPIRKEVFTPLGNIIFQKNRLPVIYVTGGNQGSHFINSLIFELLPQLLPLMHVIHQTGNSRQFDDFAQAKKLEKESAQKFAGSYVVYDYVTPDIIGDIYRYADIVIARAGINTLCELFALHKKAIIIPLPKTSRDEQSTNAQFFASIGLGLALQQSEATPDRLYGSIIALLESPVSSDVLSRADAHVDLKAANKLAELALSTL